MLTDSHKKNIKLFDLVDYNNSFRKILKLVKEAGDNEVNEEIVYSILGKTPTTEKIARSLDIPYLKKNYSLWCLLYYDVTAHSIEKLKKSFSNLNALAMRKHELEMTGLHEATINRIILAINELELEKDNDIENEIAEIVRKCEPISNQSLKSIVFSKYYNIDSKMLDDLFESMIAKNIMVYDLSGYRIKRNYLLEYLQNSATLDDQLVYERCLGMTLEACGNKYNVTRERIRQRVARRIKELPVFESEKDYFILYEQYQLTKKDIELLQLDPHMWNYVELKYGRMNSTKTAIDYVKENGLSDTEIGRKVFKEHEILILDNEIIKNDFIELFMKFIYQKGYKIFNLTDVAGQYNDFLKGYNVLDESCYITNDLDVISRKLENSGFFLNAGSKKFLLYEPDSLSSVFLEHLKQFLSSVEGYCSMLLFFEKNTELCHRNGIHDENSLFIITKRLFAKEYADKIDFIRNPTLIKKGVNREVHLENLLLDIDLPCTVDEYLNFVYEVTGLKQGSVLANFNHIINKYKNSEGLLSIDNEYTEDEKKLFLELLNDRNCIGTKIFDLQVKQMFGNKSSTFLNANTLRRFGYFKTTTSIYKESFSSRLEAVVNSLNEMDMILNENTISRVTNLEFLTYRQYGALSECLIVKIGDDRFLNLVKRKEQHAIKLLKQDLVSLINTERIYVLDEFIESHLFRKLLDEEKEYNSVLYSFDTREIIKFIIMTTDGINYLTQGNTLLFSKGEVSYNKIFRNVMEEYEILTLDEFKEIVFDKYGITKYFSNNDLSNMGYYCPYTSEKIYLSKEYYDYEMEEYLNGNS